MPTRWGLRVPSTATSDWPQQYQPIDTAAQNDTDKNALGCKMNSCDQWKRGDTANLTKIDLKNHSWLCFEQNHKSANRINHINIINNVGHVSSTPAFSATSINTDQPAENNLLAERLSPVSGFLTEKPSQFNPLIESPKANYLNEKVRILLDLKTNITPYSWQTESPLANRSDNYLNREIYDHFMQYDLEKNHCVTCGFQTKLERF